MVFEAAAALHLRFRDETQASAPPDVDAFLRGSPTSDSPLDDEFGVLPGAGPIDPSAPLVIFLQHPEFGIPAPGYDHSLPDLDCWSVRPTNFGWIASVSPPPRSAGPRRAVQLLAGCLALTLPIPASADAPAPPPVQAPASSKATATVPPPSAPVTPAPATTEPAEASPTPPALETPPPAPSVQDSTATADAAWDGVDGFVVVIVLKGGKSLRGRIGAVQKDTFTFIDSSDGQILVIPKSGVSSVRAYVPPPVPDQNGGGLIAGGSVLTALGGPVFLTGIVFVALCPSCVYLHVPMLVVGGGGLAAGIPMIAKGVQRRTAFQKALEEHRIVPMVSRTPYQGWTGGLTIRF